jgi:hypothetical protein
LGIRCEFVTVTLKLQGVSATNCRTFQCGTGLLDRCVREDIMNEGRAVLVLEFLGSMVRFGVWSGGCRRCYMEPVLRHVWEKVCERPKYVCRGKD